MAATFVLDAGILHAKLVAELHARAFARGWSEDEVAALLADRCVIGLVAVRRGLFRQIPAGFLLAREAAGEAEVLSVGVLPEARGRGVGHALLAGAMERLRGRGVRDLFLEVEEGNRPALALYRRLGFEQRGRRESYYRDPAGQPSAALVMRRGLD